MPSMLDDILARLGGAPESEVTAIREEVLERTKHLVWVPNPGPQTEAYLSEADELFYGGSPGCGKSSLICGLAVTEHKNSLILRRQFPQIKGLVDEVKRILGNKDGYNGQEHVWRNIRGGREIEFGSCQHEDDKEKYQGRAHDLKGFDEITHFLESQYLYIIGWNRPADADVNQRCRVVCTGNPPTSAEGLWVIKRWGAWLDPTHPNPAKPGELRWYTTIDGKDTEVDGPGPYDIDGREVYAKSRTFIPGKLEDNPDLADTGYAATIEAMPEPMRTMMREGRFDLSIKDDPEQLIPTAWVLAAQARWTKKPPVGIPMCAIGVDVAQGGEDCNVIAIRYDAWFAELIRIEGVETPVGTDTAGVIVGVRLDNALVTIDCGGGYGGSAYKHMKDNGIECFAYKGAESTTDRTADRLLGFYNVRAAAYWKFREALDPGQRGGSMIALPPDTGLLSDLTAIRYDTHMNVIRLEKKEKQFKRLGRSTDDSDAVVIAWYRGQRMSSDYGVWQGRMGKSRRTVKVNLGHQAARRRR